MFKLIQLDDFECVCVSVLEKNTHDTGYVFCNSEGFLTVTLITDCSIMISEQYKQIANFVTFNMHQLNSLTCFFTQAIRTTTNLFIYDDRNFSWKKSICSPLQVE